MDNIQKSYLVETARWQKILGLLMAIGIGFMAVAGLFFTVAGLFFPDAVGSADQPAAYFAIVGIVYILAALLYSFFARYLLRSAKFLKAWGTSEAEDDADLTEGLRNTKSFFKLSGILSLIGIAVAIIMMIVMVVILIAQV